MYIMEKQLNRYVTFENYILLNFATKSNLEFTQYLVY